MKPTKKSAKKKTRIDTVIDLVDCYIDEEITEIQLVEKLMKVVDKPIIEINDTQFNVREWKDCLYLNCRAKCVDGMRDNWCDVSDLSDFTVFEYNKLVDELNKHYPDYPIEYLEGRFV